MNLNKTYLIIGGASAASLVVGAVGGYFTAKRKFDKELPEIIREEIEAIEKHYAIRLEELKKKPASPADIPRQETKVPEKTLQNQYLAPGTGQINQYHNLTKPYQSTNGTRPETPAARAGRLAREAAEAKGEPVANLNPVKTEEEHNIWEERESSTDHEKLTLRGKNGRFVSPSEALKQTVISDTEEPTPISFEDFMAGHRNFEQQYLLWHIENQMLVNEADDNVVEIESVGGDGILGLLEGTEENKDGEKLIFVRNEGEGIDYQVKLSYVDLGDVMAGSESE